MESVDPVEEDVEGDFELELVVAGSADGGTGVVGARDGDPTMCGYLRATSRNTVSRVSGSAGGAGI